MSIRALRRSRLLRVCFSLAFLVGCIERPPEVQPPAGTRQELDRALADREFAAGLTVFAKAFNANGDVVNYDALNQALASFRHAQKRGPADPYPVLYEAMALSGLQRHADAIGRYAAGLSLVEAGSSVREPILSSAVSQYAHSLAGINDWNKAMGVTRAWLSRTTSEQLVATHVYMQAFEDYTGAKLFVAGSAYPASDLVTMSLCDGALRGGARDRATSCYEKLLQNPSLSPTRRAEATRRLDEARGTR